jgi:predicted CoA-binding protein
MIDKNTPLYGKKTVIVGVSPSRHGYAALAYDRLMQHDHEVILIGKRSGKFDEKDILDIHEKPDIADVDTITLYINPSNQQPWHHYLIGLNPSRIIFNPGTENAVLKKMADEKGIETVYGCTLVMLSIGAY